MILRFLHLKDPFPKWGHIHWFRWTYFGGGLTVQPTTLSNFIQSRVLWWELLGLNFFVCDDVIQFSSVAQLCPPLCDPMDCSMPGFPVHHQLPEFTQTRCPLSRWCHPTISTSVVPFSSCLQYFPASGYFQMSQLFTSGGQRIGVSASASVLSMNIQGWWMNIQDWWLYYIVMLLVFDFRVFFFFIWFNTDFWM